MFRVPESVAATPPSNLEWQLHLTDKKTKGCGSELGGEGGVGQDPTPALPDFKAQVSGREVSSLG